MPEGAQHADQNQQPEAQAEAARKAFEREFERFVILRSEAASAGLTLKEAEALQRDLIELRTRHTGKKSELAAVKKLIGRVAPENRASFGQSVQQIEADILQAIDEAEQALRAFIDAARTQHERIDVTLPGRRTRRGHLHPITLLRQRIEDIFVSLGYVIEDDREIETDFYNFDALNIPEGHPARASQDTFYTTEGFALRSQTSTVQIHAMQRRGAPVRMIAPGRVFRRDTPDPTHNPMFFQVEGLCVDHGITMAHLKGTLEEFVHQLVGPETRTRFRPSYFPFTEPSAEVDVSCTVCGGSGCSACKGTGWLEIMGAGMVDPNVFDNVGIDAERYTGFAFGMGPARIAMLRYKLPDIRLLYESDARFLAQFSDERSAMSVRG
ncbi:MAG TPA: phenylalanine--tRNA ligase subunit alpha [Pyrinomonadaceae bacterium]|nr:phenylalanine--tRNA ligase subunit alpha [Pyrinomonadaceae bacterium]